MGRPKPWRFAERARREGFRNEAREATKMRAFVVDFLDTVEVPEHISDEILMAVGEVVANACRHGRRPKRPGAVTVSCEMADSAVRISVGDKGPGFDVDAVLDTSAPDLLSPGGRGFFLMHQLMDGVEVDSNGDGTTVVLTRALPR